MKLFFASLAALCSVTSALPLAELDDGTICSNKGYLGQSVVNAIGRFCQKEDIVVPSEYANEGKRPDWRFYSNTLVLISGNCDPPQWVPQEWCFTQFYRMCANGDPRTGTSRGIFGNDGCQQWAIFNQGNAELCSGQNVTC